MPRTRAATLLLGLLALCLAATPVFAQDLGIYADGLGSGWQDWSWCARDLASTAYVHGGERAVAVTYTGAWQGFYLHHAALDTAGHDSLAFWIHGGTTSGRRIRLAAVRNDAEQPGVALDGYIEGGGVAAGTWRRAVVPLAALGVADVSDFTGFWLMDDAGRAQPTFYLDDVQLLATPPPAVATLTVDAGRAVGTADARMFGVNTAVWDAALDAPATVSLLAAMGIQALRFPGGSLSDEYHWATNTTRNNTWTWAASFDDFAAVARATGARAIVTVNYGSGTAQEAANWVRYANVTRGYGVRDWEIGNENYGPWEYDLQPRPHDPYTYALRARDYLAQMKAVDPTIRVGVVVVGGEDSYATYTDHPATNPRTGQVHHGWTPVMLSTLRSLGVMPDFVVVHRYPQEPWTESDAGLLQSGRQWAAEVAGIRQMLADYLGAAAAAVEIVCTEHNSVSYAPGSQTTSLVNGLFMADSLGQALQTELRGLLWWDLRNGQESGNNDDPALYGWRPYGDYGLVSPANDRYPASHVATLLRHFARGGDTIVAAASDAPLLALYAARRADGTLALLAVNKSPSRAQEARITVAGFTPAATGVAHVYGISQDEAARTGIGSPEVASATVADLGPSFAHTFPPYSATVLALAPAASPPPPAPAPPAAPTGLTATAMSKSRIDLRWTDNATNETAFEIERSTDGVTFVRIATVAADVRTYRATGLKANRQYWFRVRATNADGASDWSNTATARTLRR